MSKETKPDTDTKYINELDHTRNTDKKKQTIVLKLYKGMERPINLNLVEFGPFSLFSFLRHLYKAFVAANAQDC